MMKKLDGKENTGQTVADDHRPSSRDRTMKSWILLCLLGAAVVSAIDEDVHEDGLTTPSYNYSYSYHDDFEDYYTDFNLRDAGTALSDSSSFSFIATIDRSTDEVWSTFGGAAVLSASDEDADGDEDEDEDEEGTTTPSDDEDEDGPASPSDHNGDAKRRKNPTRLLPSNTEGIRFCDCCLMTSLLISCLTAFSF
ncbi:uncharacterized protein V6R79_016455 [Siganus canaliculatus]